MRLYHILSLVKSTRCQRSLTHTGRVTRSNKSTLQFRYQSAIHNFLNAQKTSQLVKMSSGDAYSSFLDQANQNTGANRATTRSQSKPVSTKAVDTEVPATLQKVEQYYTSEADEPFEPVSLKWSGSNMPSESKSTVYGAAVPRKQIQCLLDAD